MIQKTIQDKYKGRLVFAWAFIFLFFIIYNILSKIGFISRVFGGFYTFSILFSSSVIGGLFLRHLTLSIKSMALTKFKVIDGVNNIFLLFLLLFFVRVIIGYFEGSNLDVVQPLGGAVIRFFCLYIICVYMPIEDEKFYRINFFSFCWASAFLLIFYLLGGNEFIIFSVDGAQELDRELDYQGVAVAYSLLAIFGVNYIKNIIIRFLCWIISLCVLFLVDARSEFVLVLIVLFGLEFIFNRDRTISYILAFQFGFLSILIYVLILFFGYDFEINSRMGGVIDISNDESMLARDYLNNFGYQSIKNNLVFGDFASYPPGQYMHNIFSAWVDLGFAGFFLLLLILMLCLIVAFRSKITKERSIVLMLFVACVILLLFTKAYFYILLPVALGLFVGSYSKKINQY